MGELPVETAVSSPSDSGGVVQLEGTVGCQLRKSSLTSGGMLAGEIVVSGVEEWSLSDMGDLLSSFASPPSAFMCDTVTIAIFNFPFSFLLYDVASEVSPMWLTPVYL